MNCNEYSEFAIAEEEYRFYEKYSEHTEVLKEILYISIDDILSNWATLIFEDLIWRSFAIAAECQNDLYEKKELYYRVREEELLRCIDEFRGKRERSICALTIENGLDQEMYLLEECYADMICILSLNLPLIDYLYSILETLDMTGFTLKDIEDTIVIARVAVVFSVMHYDIGDKGVKECDFRWENSQLEKIEKDSDAARLCEKAMKFISRYINGVGAGNILASMPEMTYSVCDKKSLREILKYLLTCRVSYSRCVSRDKKEAVKKIYNFSQMKKEKDFFEKITKMLAEHEDEVYKDIPEWIKMEKGCEIDDSKSRAE